MMEGYFKSFLVLLHVLFIVKTKASKSYFWLDKNIYQWCFVNDQLGEPINLSHVKVLWRPGIFKIDCDKVLSCTWPRQKCVTKCKEALIICGAEESQNQIEKKALDCLWEEMKGKCTAKCCDQTKICFMWCGSSLITPPPDQSTGTGIEASIDDKASTNATPDEATAAEAPALWGFDVVVAGMFFTVGLVLSWQSYRLYKERSLLCLTQQNSLSRLTQQNSLSRLTQETSAQL